MQNERKKIYKDTITPFITKNEDGIGLERITFKSKKLLKLINTKLQTYPQNKIEIQVETLNDNSSLIYMVLEGSEDLMGTRTKFNVIVWKKIKSGWLIVNDDFDPRLYQSLFKRIENVLGYRFKNVCSSNEGSNPVVDARTHKHSRVGSPATENSSNEPPASVTSEAGQKVDDEGRGRGDTDNENKLFGIRDEHDSGTRHGSDSLFNKSNYDVYSQQYIDGVLDQYEHDPQLVKKVNKLFRNIFEFGDGNYSQRLDVKKLTKHLYTYKDLRECYRQDVNPPKLLIFYDLSDSMASIIGDLVRMIKVITKINHNIIIVVNTNATPQRLYMDGNEKIVSMAGKNYKDIADWYLTLFKDYDIRYVLNFADMDGTSIWADVFNQSDCKWSWFHYYLAKRYHNNPKLMTDKKEYLPSIFHKNLHRMDLWYAVGNMDAALKVLSKVRP